MAIYDRQSDYYDNHFTEIPHFNWDRSLQKYVEEEPLDESIPPIDITLFKLEAFGDQYKGFIRRGKFYYSLDNIEDLTDLQSAFIKTWLSSKQSYLSEVPLKLTIYGKNSTKVILNPLLSEIGFDKIMSGPKVSAKITSWFNSRRKQHAGK